MNSNNDYYTRRKDDDGRNKTKVKSSPDDTYRRSSKDYSQPSYPQDRGEDHPDVARRRSSAYDGGSRDHTIPGESLRKTKGPSRGDSYGDEPRPGSSRNERPMTYNEESRGERPPGEKKHSKSSKTASTLPEAGSHHEPSREQEYYRDESCGTYTQSGYEQHPVSHRKSSKEERQNYVGSWAELPQCHRDRYERPHDLEPDSYKEPYTEQPTDPGHRRKRSDPNRKSRRRSKNYPPTTDRRDGEYDSITSDLVVRGDRDTDQSRQPEYEGEGPFVRRADSREPNAMSGTTVHIDGGIKIYALSFESKLPILRKVAGADWSR